jgi:hypothetical protein
MNKHGDKMAKAEPARYPQPSDCAHRLEITLVEEAAAEIANLSNTTGLSPETLLETAISLLRTAVTARALGRRIVMTTAAWWPIKQLVLPKSP